MLPPILTYALIVINAKPERMRTANAGKRGVSTLERRSESKRVLFLEPDEFEYDIVLNDNSHEGSTIYMILAAVSGANGAWVHGCRLNEQGKREMGVTLN